MKTVAAESSRPVTGTPRDDLCLVGENSERSPLYRPRAVTSAGGTQQQDEAGDSYVKDATSHGTGAHVDYLADAGAGLLVLWPILLSSVLEWFEFGVFAFVEDELTANFFTTAAQTWQFFALSFLLRPIGGLLIGLLGDKIGRKRATLYAVCGMTVATVGQGCLPSRRTGGSQAEATGMWMLLVLRCIQGLCTGGEAGAVVTYISEQANRGTKGIMVACVGGSQNLAYGLAASVVWLMRMSLTEEQMVMWGWRVPFLLSAVPAYFCLSRLSQMEETKEFKQLGLNSEADAMQVMTPSRSLDDTVDVIRNYGDRVLLCFFGIAGQAAISYAGITYAVNFIADHGGNIATATAMGAGGQFLGFLAAPVFGALTDSVGVSKVVMAGMGFCIMVALPAYMLVEAYPRNNLALFVAMVLLLGVGQASAGSTLHLFASELFPTKVRNAALGLALNLSVGVFGGCAPLICELMDDRVKFFPGYYITFLCAVSLVTLAYCKHAHETGAKVMAHMRPELY